MKTKAAPLVGFKALDEAAGQFEAIVSVFGNVDRVGDRVVKGAFTKSLADWKQKGRPIPVVFSHLWDNLDAHIGEVLESAERDDGLWVKARLDMDDPYAAKTFRLMKRGTLAEFSFAFDVIQEKAQNGANELLELDLIEVGPTLKGINEETRLLAVKALGLKAGRRNSEKDAERIQGIHDQATELGAECASSGDDEDGKARKRFGAKQAIAGSFEATRDALTAAVRERYAESRQFYVFVHSTFEERAIIGIVDWRTEGGLDSAAYREVAYTWKDGLIELGDETEVAIETIVIPKEDGKGAKPPAKPEDSPGAGKGEEPRVMSTFAARVATELIELGAPT